MVLMSGLGFFMTGNGRTDNRVRRSPYSQKGNIGESDIIAPVACSLAIASCFLATSNSLSSDDIWR